MANLEKLREFYLGDLDNGEDITIEQADKYKVWVYWKCRKGHKFRTTTDFAEDMIEHDYCECCQRLRNEIPDHVDFMYMKTNSILKMDLDLFNGEISKLYIPTENNFTSELSYKSTKSVMWNIDGKMKKISPNKMTIKFAEENQNLLKSIYEKGKDPGKSFGVIKCEACGKYFPYFKEKKLGENAKCSLCGNYIHNPFSLGRWLDKNKKINERLQRLMCESDYIKTRGLRKDDESTPIIFYGAKGIITTNAFCISHKIISL